MIWFLFGGVCLAISLFLLAPLYTKSAQTDRAASPLAFGLFALLLSGSLGLYALIGRPDLALVKTAQAPTITAQPSTREAATPHESEQTFEQLIDRLEETLKSHPDDPHGWILYARSLMTMKRYDDAIKAYEHVLDLTDNNAQIREEFRSAQNFLTRLSRKEQTELRESEPTQSDFEAAAQMSPKEREVFIQGMVDGLSAKLEDDPSDPNQWVRLLRARAVLNQSDQAQIEIARMKATFENSPDMISNILKSSGWEE